MRDKTRVSILVLWLVCIGTACSPASQEPGPEATIDRLIADMSLEEKIGQTAQRDLYVNGKIPESVRQAVRRGEIGSFLNVVDRDVINELQRIAVAESPHGIPLLFGRDVIHGFKTVFPIPLGQAATWHPELVRQGARIAAVEASTRGLRWTFSPMIDIARDPRWGRVAESFGEDPYLSSVLARAMIHGYQGSDLSDPTSLAACAKHFAGYGAAEGGRDYNTTHIPERLLRDIYLPPFQASVEAGVATFMTGFNDLNGVPASGNRFLLTEVLRGEWGFDGLVVSDYTSIEEMTVHGFARDEEHAAERAFNAGVDMEMVGRSYEKHLAGLIRAGRVSERALDEAVRRILRVKLRLGLFERPYAGDNRDDQLLQASHLSAARQAARESVVLLKNREHLLPLADDARVAVIGPLADAPHEQLGTWTFDGDKNDTVTPLAALRARVGDDGAIVHAPGLAVSRTTDRAGFTEAVAAARKADVVLFFGGEEAILSGEAHSRADIGLPGAQEALLAELAETGTPVVLVILAGRPLAIEAVLDRVDAVLMAWHPGTMGGPALADILYGEVSPSGRLPMTWPKSAGQIPVYYNHKNTGRPASEETFIHMDDIPVGAEQHSTGHTSDYMDLGFRPRFPFGYGLTYGRFEYSDLRLESDTVSRGETLRVSVELHNHGGHAATEVAQLYVRDRVGDVTRPVRELKDFQRVTLDPGESRTLRFELDIDALAFHNLEMRRVVEPGAFDLWVGPNAAEGLRAGFEVKAGR